MMLSERQGDSLNPLMMAATRKAIERQREMESSDPVLFARRAGFDPDPWQSDLLSSNAKQIILNCSRQSGKSTVSAAIGLHTALFEPKSLVLLLSPSLRQSQELFRKVKDLLNSLHMEAREESALRLEFDSGSRIVCLPGTEQTIRGFSAVSLLICDEAARIDDGLFYAIRPMLAVSQGKIIMLSSPYGKRGIFHQVWTEGGDDWLKVRVTATDCPRITAEFLEQEKRTMPDWVFRAEYLCEFTETDDAVFRYDDIQACLSSSVQVGSFGGLEL